MLHIHYEFHAKLVHNTYDTIVELNYVMTAKYFPYTEELFSRN